MNNRNISRTFEAGRSSRRASECALRLVAAALLQAAAGSILAEVHYVDVNSTNATPPYTNWTTAATNIQDAVDAAVAGDEVVVTNGIYDTGGRAAGADSTPNRVAVDKPLSVRSVNGPQVTIIYGLNFPWLVVGASVRCVYLTNGASLSGFTLTKGYVHFAASGGGGVFCSGKNAVVSNCVITGNWVFGLGSGGISGGGALHGTLNNCTLTSNLATIGTGVGPHSHAYLFAYGGGAAGCTLNNCTLSGNLAGATNLYNGFDNSAEAYGGGAAYCTLNNCTLNGNSAEALLLFPFNNGISAGGGAYYCGLNNCILFWNTNGFACEDCNSSGWLGGNNWYGDPLFVDTNGWANLRLQSNSPCINAGNNAFAPAGPDLDGNPRIVGGTVDIGAYEFQSPVSQISYAWLQQYGLPINSSADMADPDGDGVNNYHEWLAGTDPTNPFSSPAQLTITPSGTNVILTWSTNAVAFTLQSTTNLDSSAVWTTNSPAPVVINGQNTVTNPITGAQKFYRLIQ